MSLAYLTPKWHIHTLLYTYIEWALIGGGTTEGEKSVHVPVLHYRIEHQWRQIVLHAYFYHHSNVGVIEITKESGSL